MKFIREESTKTPTFLLKLAIFCSVCARARVSVCDVMRRQRSSRAEYVWQSVGQRDRESLARRGTGTQQTRIAATLSGKIKANK